MTSKNAIVLPTDFSELSLTALPWATRIAAMLDAQIHCLYAVEESYVYAAIGATSVPMPTADELVVNAESIMDTFIDQHLQRLGQEPVRKVMVGKPSDVIVDYAKSIDARMIVIATHGHGRFKHLLLGSTVETVLRSADCPVLSVRNADEES